MFFSSNNNFYNSHISRLSWKLLLVKKIMPMKKEDIENMDDYWKGIIETLDQLEVIDLKSIPIRVVTLLILNLTPIYYHAFMKNYLA